MTTIIVNIDVMLARRKMSVTELADKVVITIANLSILKTEKPERSGSPLWGRSAKHWIVSRAISSNTGTTRYPQQAAR